MSCSTLSCRTSSSSTLEGMPSYLTVLYPISLSNRILTYTILLSYLYLPYLAYPVISQPGILAYPLRS